MFTLLILVLILFTPLWAMLAHDFWQFKNSEDLQTLDQMVFSDVGWMWVTYHPSSYSAYQKRWSPDFWESYVDPLLHQDAIFLAGGISLFLCLIVIPIHIKGLKRHEEISNLDRADSYSFSGINKDLK